MSLDPSTLLVVAVMMSAVAAGLLLLSWIQHPSVTALAMWSLCFLMGAVGIALVAARGAIPDVWSVVIGNTILATAYGIMWGGARSFVGGRVKVPFMLAGGITWLIACQFAWFYELVRLRITLMAAIIALYTLLSAWEFWRTREDGLVSRWPVIVLLVLHSAIVLARIPIAFTHPVPDGALPSGFTWITAIVVEAILFAFCAPYFAASMVRERISQGYRQASLTDPLTGVANRRAFFERGERLLRRAARDRGTPALLLFDLDTFKQLNDTFGHQAGDEALKVFSQVATEVLRPNDLFGRVGGEEFACVIPQCSLADALQAAERIRHRFAVAPIALGEHRTNATVSVGVGVAGAPSNMDMLFAAADRALYRAKQQGRNCVAKDELGHVPVAQLPAAG